MDIEEILKTGCITGSLKQEYTPGERQVWYYPDGSGHPGSPECTEVRGIVTITATLPKEMSTKDIKQFRRLIDNYELIFNLDTTWSDLIRDADSSIPTNLKDEDLSDDSEFNVELFFEEELVIIEVEVLAIYIGSMP